MTLKLKASRKYPSLSSISDDPKSHTLVLKSVIEALEIHERRTKDVNSSFVRVQDLVDMGLVSLVNGNFNVALGGSSESSGSGSNSYAYFVGG